MSAYPLLRSAAFRFNLKSHHRLFSLLLAVSILAAPFIWAHTRSGSYAQTAAGARAQAEKDVRRLDPGKPIERELAGGQSHSYKITLAAGQYLDAVVEQRGIDVVVTLFGPDGKQLIEVDSPNGDRGPEPVSWIVETAGDYRLSARSLKKDAAAGRYEVKVVELRAATYRDRRLVEALKLLNEATNLQGQRKHALAISLAKRAVAIQEKALGTESPIVAQSLNKLAALHQDKFDYASAEPIYQRAIAIQEKALGPESPDLANSLYNLAESHRANRANDKAESLYLRVIAIREKVLGPEHMGVALSLHRLAYMLDKNKGDYARAEPLYLRSLAILEKVLGPEHKDVVNSLDNLADLYKNKSDNTRIEQIRQRILAIQEKSLGLDHPDVATALNNLAILYYNKGDYARAEPLYQRALAILERSAEPKSLSLPTALDNLANLYKKKGDYARAEPLYLRSIAIKEKNWGAESLFVADSLYSLAETHVATRAYDKAEPLYQRAIAIYEKSRGPEHRSVANSLNSLAILYNSRGSSGDDARAEPLFQRALAILEKVLGPEHPDFAIALDNLAHVYNSKGDYARADSLFKRALAIQEKVLGSEHLDFANALSNLAKVHGTNRAYDKAEPLYLRALAIREKVQGPEHFNVSIEINNLAMIYANKGDYASANPLFQRALAIAEKILGPGHLDVSVLLDNLAVIYTDQGDYAGAEQFYQRSLAIQEKALGPEHPDVAAALNSLAGVYRRKGDYARAEQFYQRSLAIWEKDRGPNHPKAAISFNSLGTVYEAGGKVEQAVRFHRRAAEVDELNLNRNLVSDSERQKLAYLDSLSKRTSQIISLHIRSAPNDPAALDLAVGAILRRKGRALDVMTDSIAALRRRATPEDQALLDRLKETRSQLARLTLNGPQKNTRAEHLARIKTLEEQIEKLGAELSGRSAEFRALSQPVTTAAVQAAIPAGSALVEFFAYRPFNLKAEPKAGPKAGVNEAEATPRYVAYVLRRAGKPGWVELGETKAIDAAVNKLRLALRDPSRRDVKRLAREVDRLVMDPLRPLLTPSRRVFLSTDGALNLVPFAALVDQSGQYLVKRYEFSYLTSGRDLLRLQAPRQSRRSAMVVVNPDFGKPPNPGPEGGRGTELKYQPGMGSRSSILSNAFFPPLSGTAEEAKALKSMLPGAAVLVGAQANEASIKRAAGPRILHIATHGFFLPDVATPDESRGLAPRADNPRGGLIENPLLRSGLALSGANLRKTDAGQEDDGVLTAEEASALDLWGTKLVVLSACDTGVSEFGNGGAVYGLRRTLALAGAETQMMSLWPVSDKATRDLMIEYYKKLLSGRGRSEALRAMQLSMLAGGARASDRSRKTGKPGDYSHPYYWACFIQSGEWRSLDLRETPSR